MKNFIAGLTLLLSMSSFSSEITIEDKANMATFKMIVEVSSDSLLTLSAETKFRSEELKELGALNLVAKSKLRKISCGNVKATLGASLTMIGTSLEQSAEALKKLEVSDEQTSEFESGFSTFIAKSKIAMEKCENIAKSATSIEEARVGLNKSLVVLEKIIPKLID